MASTYHQPAPVLRIPAEMHGHKSDLDPTEWKPKLGDSHRKTSEAFRYLSQFHQTMNNSADATFSDTPNLNEATSNGGLGLFRPVYYNTSVNHATKRPAMHKSTMSMSTMTTTTTSTPSLSLTNTPTTAASSFDSTTHMHMGYDHGHDHYDFNLRPLPPRQNPLYYSTSAGVGRGMGVDLVTPHVAPPGDTEASSSMPAVYDHDFWGKKKIAPVTGGADAAPAPARVLSTTSNGNGLGALFGKAA
ncbi:uncharacterized protein A1O9_11798 [Exophiala aquamarina CBS 119918]|uniref:Uncharacterized protein n=1 Tax=Exophiala aquamarina CBS 119918 TaxID=1182545 RepID=A0A072NX56_9EURO|nr:uncharacterized protein A1O9_11798 [Exophiala aquamarina CBS 119918]KEF52171.1 hypothetical protein A1O9_11798 [Exophiala aquamarina CBS 119918]